MRHSTAHVMAEAVLDLFPGTQARDRAGDQGRLLLRLQARRAADAGRPRGDRGADGRVGRRRPPFVRKELPPEEGRAFFEGATSRSRSRSSTTSRRRRSATARPMPPTSVYEHGPFVDLCKGPHVASTGKIGPFKLLAVAGAYWRGDEKRPAAPADLRHGLGDPGGARRLPVAAGGGEEARPPPARRPARPVQLPRRLAGLRVLASEGPADLADARGRDARAPGPARLPGGLDADPRRARASVAAVRPLGPLPRQHVHRRRRGPAVSASSR